MARYIDADRIPYITAIQGLEYAQKSDIDLMPTADVEDVRHGKWVEHIVDASQNIKSIDKDTCSVCRKRFYQIAETGCVWRFCPNCGARMDGGKE